MAAGAAGPAAAQGPSERERFDPPVLRCRFTSGRGLARAELLAELRARSGWDTARVERVLWHGGLHLDGRPHGDEDLPERIGAGTRVDAHAFAAEPEPVAVGEERVLADRDGLVAVDKPAWLPTQATRASRRLTLEAALRRTLAAPALVAAHRLDRETSGVVLFARDPRAAAEAMRAFAEGRAHKRYLALVDGAPPSARWTVQGWIGRVLDPQRYRFALAGEPRAAGWRWSETRFERLAEANGRTLLAAAPVTGRTHQIRVHLAGGGTPIAGDAVYGGAPAPRLALHAERLALALASGDFAAEAPAPAELAAGLALRP